MLRLKRRERDKRTRKLQPLPARGLPGLCKPSKRVKNKGVDCIIIPNVTLHLRFQVQPTAFLPNLQQTARVQQSKQTNAHYRKHINKAARTAVQARRQNAQGKKAKRQNRLKRENRFTPCNGSSSHATSSLRPTVLLACLVELTQLISDSHSHTILS
jgi:hypothetical protein